MERVILGTKTFHSNEIPRAGDFEHTKEEIIHNKGGKDKLLEIIDKIKSEIAGQCIDQIEVLKSTKGQENLTAMQ